MKLKLRHETVGGHERVTVFMGQNTLANLGTLYMKEEEWNYFRYVVHHGSSEVIIEEMEESNPANPDTPHT